MSSLFSPIAFLPPPDITWIRTEERGWFRTISWNICTFLMLILLIINSVQWYRDLFTKERKSLDKYRRGASSVRSSSRGFSFKKASTSPDAAGGRSTSDLSPASSPSATGATTAYARMHKLPQLTPIYKFVTTAVQLAVFFYFIATFVGFLSIFAWGCEWIFLFSLSCWEFAKGFMYVVFIARLYTAYNESATYRYHPTCLLIFAILVSCISFVLAICSMVYAKVNPFVRYEHLKQTCGAIFPPQLTSSISLFDIFMVFICVALFLYPLIRILSKVVQEDQSSVAGHSKAGKRMIHLGLKYLIVSSVAACTSFGALMAITLHAETTFAAWDMVVNSICMMLMMPYYPDFLYYDRLCWPCHRGCGFCCNKYNKVYRLHMRDFKPDEVDVEKTEDGDTTGDATGDTSKNTDASNKGDETGASGDVELEVQSNED